MKQVMPHKQPLGLSQDLHDGNITVDNIDVLWKSLTQGTHTSVTNIACVVQKLQASLKLEVRQTDRLAKRQMVRPKQCSQSFDLGT